ncbi:YciI family protein [Litoreibacter albidus]|uniref:Uncharacterized conserved protein YciI, contains a putative active-site phosphohistidine n=1 Tax=Litoreibacter albidus TaxID=670155 RepID=A0A1H3DJB6_9RHOB|nr:YciI family protein [Litoreibacter albidus]SDX66612.1 Uncharacterized conserved protein YciI, contains a putative active-site phosphohistidine [Litoreibacter albidus]
MYIITLNLTEKKGEAAAHMAAHNEWIAKGFEDGVFLLVGGLKPQGGGAILATCDDRSEIEARMAADPFVREGIATAQIQEVSPARADQRLSSLKVAVA